MIKARASSLGSIIETIAPGASSAPLRAPLDFYALLHVSRGATKDSIFKSYERLSADPPADFGFSEKALAARKSVLDTAMETLGSPVLRREYDERLQLESVDETLPRDAPHIIAGVLILLHEAGKYDTVISLGTDAIRSKNARKFQDVALVTACSMLTTATGLLESRSSLTEAEALLKAAQGMLKKSGVGGGNQVLRIVERTIAEVHPRVALELIGSSDARVRHEGIRLLPMALEGMKNAVDKSGDRQDRRVREAWIAYLDRVRQLLSAEELVELYNISSPNVFSDAKELYYVSVAHLAIAANVGDAEMARRAREMLIKADKLAADSPVETSVGNSNGNIGSINTSNVFSRRAVEEQQRRRVAHACASLLLGDSGEAARVLGLPVRAGDPIVAGVDRQMVAFVKEFSRGSETLLPGLCALVERWMNEVALMSFYKNPGVFSLNEWFENERVVKYLETMERGGVLSRGIKSVAGVFRNFFSSSAGDKVVLADDEESVVESSSEGEDDAIEDEAIEDEAIEDEAETLAVAERATATAAMPRPAAATAPTMPTTQTMPSEPSPQTTAPPALQTRYESLASGSSASFVEELSTESQPSPPPSPSEGENQYLKGMDLSTMKLFDDGDAPLPLNEASIATLGGEEGWFRSAYEARRVRWGRVTVTSLVLLAALSTTLNKAGGRATMHRVIPGYARHVSYNAKTGTSLSKGQAHAIIAKWQRAKAEALGKQYSTRGLSDVLGDDLAKDWAARAAEMKKKSIHYVHKRLQCSVEKVEVVESDARRVVAEIRETIEVVRQDGSRPQTFPSLYKVEYEMSRAGGKGPWKIVRAAIVTK